MDNNQDSISEQSKRMNIALKYTNGDTEKAKLMTMGSMLDVIAIKGKFIVGDQNTSGVFLAFFNIVGEYIPAIKSIIELNDTFYTKTRIFDEWSIIYQNIVSYESGKDILNSEKLNGDLLNAFVQLDIFPLLESEDISTLSPILTNTIKECFESPNIECRIEFEKTSSLELELAGIEIMDPSLSDSESHQESSEIELIYDPDSPFGQKITSTESQAQFIINGNLVISPVKGTLLSEIRPNEKIYVLLTGKDQISQKVLDIFKSRDIEGRPLPILGRVISVIPNEANKGYVIYITVEQGIFVKIIEEENLRIQTEFTDIETRGYYGNDPNKKGSTKLFYLTIYGIFILLIILVIMVFSML